MFSAPFLRSGALPISIIPLSQRCAILTVQRIFLPFLFLLCLKWVKQTEEAVLCCVMVGAMRAGQKYPGGLSGGLNVAQVYATRLQGLSSVFQAETGC